MKAHLLLLGAIAALAMATGLVAEDKPKDPLEGVVCPVSGKAVKAASKAKYKEGEVYFCCDGCPGAFAKDTAKFAVKANAQLVQTGQYVATKCPIAGKDINPATKIKVAGLDVAFCCNGCKGKVEKAEGDAQVALVFGDEGFGKGFSKKK